MTDRVEIRFDGWRLHPDTGELRREGRPTQRLTQQPLRILLELLDRPGEVVTRERLVEVLWPKGVVDYDNGLNVAMRKLRVALGDDTETPRYIETLSRKGYRFVGQVESPAAGAAPAGSWPCGRARPRTSAMPHWSMRTRASASARSRRSRASGN